MPLLHVSWLWGNHGKCMEMSKCPVSSSFLILRWNMLLPSCGVPLRSLRNFQPLVLCARCVACMWTSWTLLRKKWLTVQQDDRWSHDSSGVCLVSTCVYYISRRDVEQEMLFPNTWSEPHKFIPQLAPIVASIVDRSRHKIIWPPKVALCSSQTWQSWHVMTCFCGSFESFAKFLHVSPKFELHPDPQTFWGLDHLGIHRVRLPGSLSEFQGGTNGPTKSAWITGSHYWFIWF